MLRTPLSLPLGGRLAALCCAIAAALAIPTAASSPTPAPPKYEPLIGGNLVGSGFHFESRGERYIACSMHQTDGEIPESMISMDIDQPILITGRVSRGHDTQVVRYDCAPLDEIPALVFNRSLKPSVGDRVYVYNQDGAAPGVLGRQRPKRRCVVRMDKPFAAMGASGSPVVHASTGAVIGVLLDANDPDAATVVGFELLRLE